jgi:positive regulator of sigma E activity
MLCLPAKINAPPSVLTNYMVEVVQVTQANDTGIEIAFNKRPMCDSCRASKICSKGTERLRIDSQGFDLKPGDKIKIEVNEKKSLIAALLTFLLPSIIFILVLIVFSDRGEGKSFFLAILTVCLYYGLLKVALLRYPKSFNIKIIEKTA